MACAWSLGLCVVACKRERAEDVAFDQSESFPGFTIGLPAGERAKSERTPAAGGVIIKRAGTMVAVGWQAGRMRKEDLGPVAAALRAAIGAGGTGEVPEGTDLVLAPPDYGMEFMLPTDKKVILAMSVVQCVKSNVTVTLATMAAPESERAKAFHARLVATLQCGDESSAMTRDLGLPAFDLGDAIAYLPGSDPPAYFSGDGARWYVTPGVTSMRAAFERPEALAAMMKGSGLEVVDQKQVSAPPDWLLKQLTLTIEGESSTMLAGVLTCGESAFSVMYSRGDMGAPDPAEVRRISCPTTNVDPATLPTVGDRIGGACEGGNAAACEVLAMIVDEEPKLLPDQDATKLRARACKLGATHLCTGQ